jgi:hypothetical protein
MTQLSCLCYVSSAFHPLELTELQDLLEDSRDFNARVGVTGVLLHHDGGFFQYIEGPPEGVSDVYVRIRASRLHHSIVEMLNEPVAARSFADWRMGSTHVPESTILSLRDARWRTLVDPPRRAEELSAGMILLRAFWATAAHGR